MELGIIAVLCVFDVVFAVAVIAWNISKNKNNVAKDVEKLMKPVQQPAPEPIVIEKIVKVYEEPKKEEPKEEPVEAVEEKPAEVAVNPIVLEEENEEENKLKLDINRVPFVTKLVALGKPTTEYYNRIYNYFNSFRKINPRVSQSGASFRFGRELVGKLTVRGKTMKLHLALNPKEYDEKMYFQKDMSSVKAYEEIPFTVKVKSDRALKKAQELIARLAVEKNIEAKTRYVEIDAMAEVKQKAKELKAKK